MLFELVVGADEETIVPLQVTPRSLRTVRVLGCWDTVHVWGGVLRAPAHGVQRQRFIVWCAFHFHRFVRGSSPPSLRSDIRLEYTTERA